jgi:predicted metal-binding protein
MYCHSMIGHEVTVTVCRDCCCGSTVKHPDVDHDGALARLRAAVEASGRGVVRVARCLDECARSDVVVVRRRLPSGTETSWLGWVNDDTAVTMLAEWLSAGAVGPMPDALTLHEFTRRPPRTA